VTISDLALSISGERKQESTFAVSSNRYALEVPPCGILPISVDIVGSDAEERAAAALTSQLMKSHTRQAAANELPGLDSEESIEAPWN
jgi:hypothetical protein